MELVKQIKINSIKKEYFVIINLFSLFVHKFNCKRYNDNYIQILSLCGGSVGNLIGIHLFKNKCEETDLLFLKTYTIFAIQLMLYYFYNLFLGKNKLNKFFDAIFTSFPK